jgi:ribosome-associated heat shock protein Hsp15
LAGVPAPVARETIRLDKWLWQARFFKTRGLATRAVQEGAVRLNAVRVVKPAHPIGAGDTLTFAQADRIRVVRCLAAGQRRGPTAEAQALYEDLAPPETEGGKERRTMPVSPPPPLE